MSNQTFPIIISFKASDDFIYSTMYMKDTYVKDNNWDLTH